MGNERIPFETSNYCHIYNHGNGDDSIFRTAENYYYFLQSYSQYINPIAKTFAYCLLPNHFHFFIRGKSEAEILDFLKVKDPQGFQNLEGLKKEETISKFISQHPNFLNAYAKAFNEMYDRKGSLFSDNIKRKRIDNKKYFLNLIHYIHYNPVHHGFGKSVDDWEHSSYHSLLSAKETKLSRERVTKWFDRKESFVKFHKSRPDKALILEMDF